MAELYQGLEGSEGGEILLTFNGLQGDSACSSNEQFISAALDQRSEYFRSEEEFRSRAQSREIVKSCEGVTLYKASICMTTFFGCDNRGDLPPFFPYFRMEDALFAESLQLVRSRAYFASLPFQLQHLPEARMNRLDAPHQDLGRAPVDHYVMLKSILRGSGLAMGPASPRRAMNRLADGFHEYAEMEESHFRDQMTKARLARAQAEIAGFDRLLANAGHAPDFWTSAVEAHVARLSSSLEGSSVLANAELCFAYGPKRAESVFREMLRSFGSLMALWPKANDIFRESRAVREESAICIEGGEIKARESGRKKEPDDGVVSQLSQ